MPNKTIYINKNDLPVFDAAKVKAGDSLSSVIVNALKAYLGQKAAKESGFKEVSVRNGTHEKSFMGEKIVDGYSQDNHKAYKIYETPKGQYAIVSWDMEQLLKFSVFSNDPVQQAVKLHSDPEEALLWMQQVADWFNGDPAESGRDCELQVCPTESDVAEVLPKDIWWHFKEQVDLRDEYHIRYEYLDI